MKTPNTTWLAALLGLAGLVWASPASAMQAATQAPAQVATQAAIEANEVRSFEEVFVISAIAPDRSRIEVSWDIEPGYTLYNNRFLKFTIETAGVTAGEAQVPRGEISFDELLGEEVEKYHDRLAIHVPLLEVAPGINGLRLKVRSQGCLDNVLCYPPTEQVVLVGLPSEGTASRPVPDLTQPASPKAAANLDLAAAAAPAELVLADSIIPGKADALAAEDAFIYEAIGFSADTVLVRFTAQSGYYLYRDHFAFRISDDSGFAVSEVDLPEGTIKDDPEFGPVSVIYGQVEIPVRVSRPAGPVTIVSMQADFQGCRDGDICYPPQSRVVSFEMPAAGVAASAAPAKTAEVGSVSQPRNRVVPLSEQDRLARLLTSHPSKAVFAFFIAGLLLAFTPCVFPMVPILSGIIVGQGDKLTTRRAFTLSLVYVLAMAVTYTVAGVLAGLFGQNLQAVFQNPWILSGFVLVFIALALSMFGLYELQLPAALQSRVAAASNQQAGGHLWGVAVMGFLSALIVGPCVAPPLMAALIVIGASGDAVLGGSALFAMSMGMGVPLLLFGVSAGKLVPKAGAWMNAIKAVFGVGLLALAIWLLERILPGGLIMVFWGVLAIACGVYLGALEPVEDAVPPRTSGWRRLWKALGVVLLSLGLLELAGAAAGGDNWLQPLAGLRSPATGASTVDEVLFTPIQSLQDLRESVAQANAQGQGAMLDFYADWCVECVRMERNTFSESRVKILLNGMQVLQADVTQNNQTDQALMHEFGIIGPPAILFFDRSGEEMEAWRLVGYFSPEAFAEHLNGVLASQ